MAIFNRRKNQTVAELEEYYSTKNPRSGGMAWVMAVVSLLLTILVVSALFFGGRWVYRSLTDDNNDVAVTTTETNEDNVNDFGENEPETDENFPSVVSDEAASTNTPSSSSPTSSTPTTPSTGGDLPDTGAGEVSLILIVIAFISGYYLMLKKQKSNQ